MKIPNMSLTEVRAKIALREAHDIQSHRPIISYRRLPNFSYNYRKPLNTRISQSSLGWRNKPEA